MKTIPLVAIALLAGFALATYLPLQRDNSAPAQSPDSELQARVAALEESLRQLQNRLTQSPMQQLAATEVASPRRGPQSFSEALDEEMAAEEASAEDSDPASESVRISREARRIERLQESGFPASQAAWIVQRENEIRLDSLNARWQERREAFVSGISAEQADPLRAELGEREYERYLEASGRPTSIRVARTMEGSPAQLAGLQAGDEIISYNGQRVFDLNDLNTASVQGRLGEPVLLEVIRDGGRVHIAMERGPLGIITRRNWR